MTGQTRLGSLIETLFNVAIGLAVSMVANALVFPHFGITPTFSQNVAISVIYTSISIVRSYFVRRFFETRVRRFSAMVAAKVDAACANNGETTA